MPCCNCTIIPKIALQILRNICEANYENKLQKLKLKFGSHISSNTLQAAPCSSPNRAKSEINSGYPCVIKLVSLTISLLSLPGARGSTEEVQFGLGCRCGVEGASSRAARGHVATGEETTRRRAAAPLSPVSPLLPCYPLTQPSSQQEPETAGHSSHRARRAPPKHAQAVPHLELTPRLPAPLLLLPSAPQHPRTVATP